MRPTAGLLLYGSASFSVAGYGYAVKQKAASGNQQNHTRGRFTSSYLSMPVRHGHSRQARRPHVAAPCLQQLHLAQPQEKCHGSIGAPTLPRSAALPPGPARRPRRALPAIRPRAGLHPKKGGSDREPWRGRLQPSRRAERAFFQGHGTGAVCSGFAGIALPGAAEEGGRSRCLRRPTTTMPGGGRAVKTGRTRPWPMPLGSRDGISEASAIYCRGPGCRKSGASHFFDSLRKHP